MLILDEPVASLDPLARRDFLQDLLDATAEHQMSVVLSSHLVADLERVCDYLIVLAAGRVQVAGTVTELTAGAQAGLEDLVLAYMSQAANLASCRAGCSALTSTFLDSMKAGAVYPVLYIAGIGILYITPAIIGMFWGAPLVTRELEAGTFRLAWNQSVTRTRWMAAKLAAGGLAAMLTTGLISLIITWWASPIDRAGGFPTSFGQLSRFSPVAFGARDLVPVGYAAFGFALGVTVGVLVRDRDLPGPRPRPGRVLRLADPPPPPGVTGPRRLGRPGHDAISVRSSLTGGDPCTSIRSCTCWSVRPGSAARRSAARSEISLYPT